MTREHIEYPSQQTHLMLAQLGIPRGHPDWPALFLGNQILGGGGFGARLMEEVREKRGLTYGIYTYLVPKDLAETWQGSFASANEKAAEAIDVTRAEWARMATGEVTDKELTDAKTYLTGAYPLRFDGNDSIANILVGMQLNGMPIDYVNTRNAKVDAVTKDDVARVAKRILNADDLRFVVVGRPVGLKDSATN